MAAPPPAGQQPRSRVKRVGNFIMGKTLGSGSFSKVKLATNQLTQEKVAIKIISKQFIVENHLLEQLRKEISVLKRLNHPHVVRMYEVLHSRTKIFLVMELVNGGDLFDHIVQCGHLDENVARIYFQQLISGVGYCHTQGICHRDLKPENLLLKKGADITQNMLKISDFGLSNFKANPKEVCHTTCGTPNYVAPEVVSVQAGYDGQIADLWSCGVILFVMMAGRLPFDEPQVAELFKKIIAADFVFPAWFTEESKAFIRLLLNPDPKKRVTIDAIYRHPWFTANNPNVAARFGSYEKMPDSTVEEISRAMLEVSLVPSLDLGTGDVTSPGVTPECSPRPGYSPRQAPNASPPQTQPSPFNRGNSLAPPSAN